MEPIPLETHNNAIAIEMNFGDAMNELMYKGITD